MALQQEDIRFLTRAERKLYRRLYSSDFTFEEGLKFYGSVVSNGRHFPITWEIRILELGVMAHPDRLDMRERLNELTAHRDNPDAKDALQAAEKLPPSNLTEAEKIDLARLLKGQSNLEQALRLYTSLTSRGIAFPIQWEEKALELILAEQPSRIDILSRYRHVLMMLGKQVPVEIENRYGQLIQKHEFDTDHQRAADQYNEKTAFKDTEPEFRALADRVRTFTMTSIERMYALYKSVEYIHRMNLPGAIVECGVWRGGSMMLIAHTLLALGCSDRDLYLFDTYQGLPRPDEIKDVDVWGNRAIDGWLPHQTGEESSHWANASLEDVRANLLSTGYPEERLHFVRGMVERTIPDLAPPQIALLRLDTDWYASTRHEMEHLFPRLSRDGVLILDDYGHFEGARQAVDEYVAENKLPILFNRIDYAGRLIVKTC